MKNKKFQLIIFMFINSILITSLFLTPSGMTNNTNPVNSSMRGEEEETENFEIQTMEESVEEDVLEEDSFQRNSALQKYYRKNKGKRAQISQNLEAKLSSIPQSHWKETEARLIVTFDSRYYLYNPLLSNYDTEKMSKLPVAVINTNLAAVENIGGMVGVTGIFIDNYHLFIDQDWVAKNPSDGSQIQTYPSEEMIGARDLQDLGIDGSGIKIAILDTGIDKTHPDLDDLDNNPATTDPKVILEQTFVDYTGDGIGDTTTKDFHNHGTHVAGIAAGNGLLKGVAPGAWLMNGRVLDPYGGAEISWIIRGIDWAVANGADVISLSLGWAPGDVLPLMNTAVNSAWESGVIVVIAAGNSGPNYYTVSSPGMASRAITVGASDASNYVASYSGRGPSINGIIDPDVVAPGDNIFSTFTNGNYRDASGTSMATPAVAGVVALLLSDNPSADIDHVRSALIGTATDLGLHVFKQGAGLINAVAARNYLQNPSVFAFPSFRESSKIILSPGEKFEYQFDIFLNQSFSSFSVEPSLELSSHINSSLIDPVSIGWVRGKISIMMPSLEVNGSLLIKNSSDVYYEVPIFLEPDVNENDASTNTDAGETLGGAISIPISTPISGRLSEDDSDIYTFQVIKNQKYKIGLYDLDGDLDLLVTNENGTVIGDSFNWDLIDEEILITAYSTGDYYARIVYYRGESAYNLSIEISLEVEDQYSYLTGIFNSYGVDQGTDGIFEVLLFIVQVYISKAGEYETYFSVSQKRSDYEYPLYHVYENGETMYLSTGYHFLTLSVPGGILESSVYNGEYMLNDLAFYYTEDWTLLDYRRNVVSSPYYVHDQFSPLGNRLSGYNIASTDVDGLGNPEILRVELHFEFSETGLFSVDYIFQDESTRWIIILETVNFEVTSPGRVTVTAEVAAQILDGYGEVFFSGFWGSWLDDNGISIYHRLTDEIKSYDPIVTYSISDSAVDTNFDGLVDTVRFQFTFSTKIAMAISTSLNSFFLSLENETSYYYETQYPVSTIYLGTYSPVINFLYFDARSLSAREIVGPLFFPEMYIELQDMGHYISVPYITNSYNFKNFETPDVYFSEFLGIKENHTLGEAGYDVTLEVTADYALNIDLEYRVMDADNYWYWSDFYHYYEQELLINPGKNIITLKIPLKDIFYNKFSGNLRIDWVGFYYSNSYDKIDEIYNVGIIKNVNYLDFKDSFEAYFTQSSIEYQDQDIDGLYEGISFNVELNITKPGAYVITLFLLHYDYWYTNYEQENTTVFSSPGIYNMTIFVPSKPIVRNVMRNNLLYEIQLKNNETNWVDEFQEEMEVDRTEFDYVLPVQIIDIFDYAVDENGDGLFDTLYVAFELNITISGNYEFNDVTIDLVSPEGPTLGGRYLWKDRTYYTKGIHIVSFVMMSFELQEVIDNGEWLGISSPIFFTYLNDFIVEDFEGDFSLLSEYVSLDNLWDARDFDLTPPIELISVTPFVRDISDDGIAEYFSINITVYIHRIVNYQIYLQVELFAGEDNPWRYFYEEVIVTQTGTQTTMLSMGIIKEFGYRPEEFEAEIFADLSGLEYWFYIDSYYLERETFNTIISIITPEETSNPITYLIASFALISLLVLKRKKKK